MNARRLIPWMAGVLAGACVLVATAPRGPGLTPDGMSYLGAAASFARSGTLREPFASWSSPDSTSPLTDYPAGFSLVLAGPVSLGVPPAQAARWVEALSIAGTVALAVALLEEVAGVAGAAAGCGLLLLAPAVTDVSMLALSEPLFLLLVMATLVILVRRPDRSGLAGFLAAAANLVRYAGIFLVAAAAVWGALEAGSRRERLRRAAWGAAPGVLLHVYWWTMGIAPGGGLSGGVFGGVTGALREGWATGLDWLVPGVGGAGALAAGVVLLSLEGALFWWSGRRGDPQLRRLLGACAVLGALYIGTVGFARLFVIPDVPFDSRILAPFFVIAGVAIAAALGPRPRAATVAIFVAWGVLAARRDGRVVREAWRGGLGYEASEWQDSPVAAWLRGPGENRVLYTTDPAGVYFLTGRPSRLLPDTLDPDSIRAFGVRFLARPSALVAFDVPFVEMAPGDSVVRALGLVPVARFAHGVVYLNDTLATRPLGPTSHPARALAKPTLQ